MVILLAHKDFSVRVHKNTKCRELYRQAARLFSQDIKNHKFILYFVNHKQIKVVPTQDICIEMLSLRAYPKKTTIRLMTEEVFSQVVDNNSLSVIDNHPSISSQWQELNQPQATEKTLESYEVIKEESHQSAQQIRQSFKNTIEAVSNFQDLSKKARTNQKQMSDQESLWEIVNSLQNKPKQDQTVKKNMQTSRQNMQGISLNFNKKHKPKYEVEVERGLNIKMELKTNEIKSWQIDFNNCGEKQWPQDKVGFYDLKTKIRRQNIPKLEPYCSHTLKIDCQAKQPISIIEYMFGYQYKGDLVTFGPIFRCLVSLDAP